MLDAEQATRFVVAGVVLLIGLGVFNAWMPAARHDPAGPFARVFMTVGLVMATFDFGGVGSVLGFSLATLGAFVAWEGQPSPDIPRPTRRGVVVIATSTGLAVLAVLSGWGPLSSAPEQARAVAGVVIAAVGVLATFAIADRARVRLREAISRRLTPERHDQP